jgi:hypothetical protein
MNRIHAVGVAAVLLTTAVAAPANATIDDRFDYHNVWTETFTDCGVDTISASFDYIGSFTAREIKSSDGTAWLGHNHNQFVEVYTNPANGRSFSISGDNNWREIKGIRLHDNVWEFDWKDSGSTFTVRDAAGTVLYRDRGTTVGRDVLDTGGDTVPGGTYLSSDVVALRGKFSSLDWCSDLVVPLLG